MRDISKLALHTVVRYAAAHDKYIESLQNSVGWGYWNVDYNKNTEILDEALLERERWRAEILSYRGD